MAILNYTVYFPSYLLKKAGFERNIAKSKRFDSSNLEKIIEKGLKIAANASELWVNRDFDDKQELQRLIFPEGIVYNKEKDRVRTTRVNSFFEPIPQLVRFLNGNEKSHPFKDGSNSLLVDQTRID